MKILQMVPAFYPAVAYGGPVTVSYQISKELVRRGHEVTVYTSDTLDKNRRQETKFSEIDGIKVYYFRNLSNTLAWHRFVVTPGLISQLSKEIKNFDIVHLHGTRNFQNIFAHHYAKKYGIPYVLQAHGSSPRIIEKQRLKKLYDWVWGYKILKDAFKLIAVSKVEVEQYKKIGVGDNNIVVIPNGLDVERFKNLPKYGQFREKHGIKEKYMILFLGRIHKIKGIDFLIKSFGYLIKEMKDIVLIVAGPDDGHRTYLKKLVEDLSLRDSVKFVDYVDNVTEAYQDADVLVYPAIYEIFGLVPFEAIMCGTPIIVTDDCGCGELVREANCGYLVEYGDIKELKEKMKWVIENPEEGTDMVKRGKKYIEENLSLDIVVRKVEEVYFNLIRFKLMKKQNIGIITFPIRSSIALSNLVDIIYSLSHDLHLITGDKGYTFFKKDERIHTYEIRHKKAIGVLNRIISYVWTQLRISWKLMKLRKSVDLWIFFIGGEGLVLPIITAKLLRKEAVIASAGSGFKVAQAQKEPLATAMALLQSITYRLSDRIIMYSERLVEEHSLQKYRNKISIAHEHFLNKDKFKVKKEFDKRGNIVGYIGALNKAKGVPQLLQAIPNVLNTENGVKFLIGGDGELRCKVEEFLNKGSLKGKVEFVGWIPHDEIPKYLNQLKLLALPSYTEGLPNIMLEAMACGTPVLATPVGAIPDIIKDGETGFLMENNSPECIAENVIRALEHHDLERIVENARALVKEEFTYEAAVERYRKILGGLLLQ